MAYIDNRQYIIDFKMNTLMYSLKKYMEMTFNYWNLQPRGLYHDTISLILSQKVRFHQGRKIRSELYKLLGTSIIDYDNLRTINQDKLLSLGINPNTLNTIYSIPKIIYTDLTVEIFINYINIISQIRGIGPWTIDSLKVIYYYDNIYLTKDKYINKNLSKLLDLQNLTDSEIKYLWETYFSFGKRNMCLFFWRIKTNSINKIKNFQLLDSEDFI